MDKPFELDNPFWQFSLKVYAASGVAQECLMLQEESGVDVNMLLYCAWRGTEADSLSAPAIEQLNGVVQAWRVDVVGPLREIRRGLKGIASLDQAVIKDLRGRVLSTEIFAEQIEQAILFSKTTSDDLRSDKRAGAIDANLNLYLSSYAKTVIATPALRSAALAMVGES
jgi:uncharacterized protein (TIGR02444 family)